MSVWSRYVLPRLIESACKSPDILEERRRWIPRAHGRVLEIGVGSGLNLAFYDPARVEKVVGVDPSVELARRAEARVRHAKVPIELVTAGAERLPFEAGAFDSAVMTYTLCSVDDARLALAEARRVLVPGGERGREAVQGDPGRGGGEPVEVVDEPVGERRLHRAEERRRAQAVEGPSVPLSRP